MKFLRLIPPDPLQGGELPASEFVHPLPLLALALLAVNDHWLKGAGILPPLITGKLSDFAGVFFFPLLLTACLDVALFGVHILARRTLFDASLRRWKLLGACIFTGALMIAIKLWPVAAQTLLAIIARLHLDPGFGHAQIVQDPYDLLALPMLLLSYRFGRKRIAEIPPCRFTWIRERIRRGYDRRQVLHDELQDSAHISSKSPALFQALLHGLEGFFKTAQSHADSEAQRLRAQRALQAWRA